MLWKRTRKPIRSDFQFETREPHVEQQDSFNSTHPFMDGKVLMVDQLWLWIVDKKTVVTFFPNQEASTSEEKLYEQINLHTSIYNELNGDLARRFDTAGDLAALIVLHAVTVLLDKSLQRDLQVLRIFEESISILVFLLFFSFPLFSFCVKVQPTKSGRPNLSPDRLKAFVVVASSTTPWIQTRIQGKLQWLLQSVMRENGGRIFQLY